MSTVNESKTVPIGEVRIYDAPTQEKIWEAVPTGSPLIPKDIQVFEYYESIYEPFYRAKLKIFESSGEFEKAFNGCGVRNFCMVEIIQFNDPLKDTSYNNRSNTSFTFESSKCFFVSKVTQTIQGKKQIYELELVTRDCLSSLASIVTYAWPQTDTGNANYNDIINNLMLEFVRSSKSFQTQDDAAKPAPRYYANGMQPFQVIQDICRKATSVRWSTTGSQQESGATGYMFFETYFAYKFKSIASLINLESGETIPASKQYKVTTANVSSATDLERAYAILGYKFNESGETSDIIQEIRSNRRGKPSTFVLDIQGQVFKKIESLDPIKDPCETTITDSSFGRNTYRESGFYEYELYNSCSNDLNDKPISTELTSLNYSALLEELRTRNSSLRVNGNLDLAAGDKITIIVPEIKGDGTSNTTPSDKYSGIYVVTKVAHRLENYKFFFTDLIVVKIKDNQGATATVPQ